MRNPEQNPIEFYQEEKKAIPELTPEQKEEIQKEQEWVKANFGKLIQMVNERYEKSTVLSEGEKRSYEAHNAEILNYCIERATVKRLTGPERAMLYFAAIFHDSTKGGKPPQDKKEIKNYVLAAHNEAGAEEARRFLEDEKNAEYIEKILPHKRPRVLWGLQRGEGKEYDKEKIIITIENAIRRHMGPHCRQETDKPFFMDKILAGVNAQLSKAEKISHPQPENQIDKILFASDMKSLAGPRGVQKILDIRFSVPNFRQEDGDLCTAYEKSCGRRDLNLAEAALFNALESGLEARDSISKDDDPEDWAWINESVEEAKQGNYFYGAGEGVQKVILDCPKILAKKEIYQKAKEALALEK